MPKHTNGADRREGGLFLPGHSVRNGGRPKGAKSRLSEDFLEMLHAEVRRRGPKALRDITNEKLIDAVCKVLDKVVKLDASLKIEQRSETAISVADYRAAYRLIGARVRQIEASAINTPAADLAPVENEAEHGAE